MNTSLYPEIVASHWHSSHCARPSTRATSKSIASALASPATNAAIIVAFDGDEIDTAVKAHLADFNSLMNSFSAKGQPSAAIYVSSVNWLNRTDRASF